MANYTTHFAFRIKATRTDAERFIKVIEAMAAIAEGKEHLLAAEIASAFGVDTQTPEQVFASLDVDYGFGVDCLFRESDSSLIIFDTGGCPNLSALAECLKRLYPDKLPMGFVYCETCDKSRTDGFGGGFFAIGPDTIFHQSIAQVMEEKLAEMKATSDGT
jgi:hypothetical protein